MKRILNTTTVIFGFLAGLFILNRFYDLIDYANRSTSILIIGYCIHCLIVLIFGLLLFNNKKTIGFWLLLLFESYLMIRHSLEFANYKFANPSLVAPSDIVENWTIPYYEFIFFSELIFGLSSIVFLVVLKREKTVANIVYKTRPQN